MPRHEGVSLLRVETQGDSRGRGPLVARRLAAAGIALAALALLAPAGRAAAPAPDAISRAAAALMAAQLPSGLFEYDFDFMEGKPSGEDNLVRQAGALFALGEYLVDTGDPHAAAALRAGLDAMVERSLPIGRSRAQRVLESLGLFSTTFGQGTLERLYGRLGLLYDSAGEGRLVAKGKDYEGVRSATTALALVAELAYFRTTQDPRFAASRRAWVRGLLALQVPRRGIRAVPTRLDESPYDNGEAWLALAAYHEAVPEDAEAARALVSLEDYLIALYGARPDGAFYHWGALASLPRFRSTGDPRFARFAADQARWALASYSPEKMAGLNTCSLVEGLAAAAAALIPTGGEPELTGRLRERVHLELERNRPLQIRPGQERMEGGEGAVLRAPALSRYAGAFRTGAHKAYTRTDYTQHCLSALLLTRRAGLEEGRDSHRPGGR